MGGLGGRWRNVREHACFYDPYQFERVLYSALRPACGSIGVHDIRWVGSLHGSFSGCVVPKQQGRFEYKDHLGRHESSTAG